MAITTKGKSWEFVNSLWIVLSFIPFLYWVSILIAGLKTQTKNWIFFGILYSLPFFSLFLIFPNNAPEIVKNIWAIAFISAHLTTIFHSFGIRKQYLLKISGEKEEDVQQKNTQQTIIEAVPAEYRPFLNKIYSLRADIIKQIEYSEKNNFTIVDGLETLVNSHVEQTEEIIRRDIQLQKILKNAGDMELTKSVAQLKLRLQSAQTPELKQEYQKTIDRYEQHRNSLKDITEQREILTLRMNSAYMSLKQVKIDLLKMENLDNQKQIEVFKDFEEKTNELSYYLKALKDSYSEEI